NRADGCVKQSSISNVVLLAPEADKSFLDNVFRVIRRTRPLPGEEHQAGRKLTKASLPIFIGGDILHDLFTVFYNCDDAKFCFCLNRPGIFLDYRWDGAGVANASRISFPSQSGL